MRRGPYRRYLQDINVPIPGRSLRRRLQNIQRDISCSETESEIEQCNEECNSSSKMELIDSSISNTSFSDPETLNSFNSDTTNSITDSTNEDIEEIYQDALEEDMQFLGPNRQNPERCVLYDGCELTLQESKFLIMAYALRYNLSDKALESLIQLVDCHLPDNRHGSLFLFLKDFPKAPNVTTYFYCHIKTCKRLLQFVDIDIVTCECGAICEKTYLQEAGCYFLHISLKDQLTTLLSYRFIRQELRWSDESQKDIINSDTYKSLLQNGSISKGDITLQWNTDGVQLHKSSNMQLWPIQVCLNELPFKIRKDNILLCGLWYGPGKPNMNTFLQPFVEELNTLHTEGIQCFIPHPITIRVHTLVSSVDSMARPLLQNIKTFRGNTGCSFCLHPGEEYTVGRGRTRLYRGNLETKRSLQQHRNDSLKVIRNGQTLNGIKGPSVLLLLKGFNIIDSFVPEYMHCVLLGVVKTMVSWWMDGKNKKRSFYIGNNTKVNKMNEILLSIKPPTEITRTPRSLHDKNLWKASEWKNFLLYYSCICLQHVNMPKKYLDHWFLLVYSIHIFLKEQFSELEFEKAERALTQFVLSIEDIYGTPELMKYNFHLLLHISNSVKSFGGLWAVSAFPYEHFNGVLAKMFKNSRSVSMQICKNYLRMCRLQEMTSEVLLNENCSSVTKHLYEKLTLQKYSYKYCLNCGNSLRMFGVPYVGTLTLREKFQIEALVGQEIYNFKIPFFKRFIYKNVLYHIKEYQNMNKRTNSIIQLQNKEFISITRVMFVETVSNNRLCVLLGLKLHCTGESLYRNGVIGITSNSIFSVVEQTNELVAIFPHMFLTKCIITPHPNNIRKFCCFPLVNSIERD